MIQAAVAFAQPEHFGAAWSHFILRSRQRWHAGICAPSSAMSNVHALMHTKHLMESDGRADDQAWISLPGAADVRTQFYVAEGLIAGPEALLP